MLPILVSGVVVPWNKSFSQGRRSQFKLITKLGVEYFLIAGSEWEDTLSWHSWDEVKVRGLVDMAKRTIVPKKIYPKDPAAKRQGEITVDDLDSGKTFDLSFFQRMVNHGYTLEPRVEEIGGALQ